MWALALTYVVSIALLLGFEYPLDRLRDRLYAKSGQGRAGARAAANDRSRYRLAVGGLLLAAGILSVVEQPVARGNRGRIARGIVSAKLAIAIRKESPSTAPDRWSSAPAFAAGNRVVLDLGLEAASGGAWAGVESDDGRFRVGIRRVGDACHLEIGSRTASGRRPTGVECRLSRPQIGPQSRRRPLECRRRLALVAAVNGRSREAARDRACRRGESRYADPRPNVRVPALTRVRAPRCVRDEGRHDG